MNKLAALTLSLFLVGGTAFADTPKDADPQPAKPKTAAKPAEKSDAAIAAELEALRQSLQAQQEQLNLLKEELAKRDRQIDEAREEAAAANARAAEASTKATDAVAASAAATTTAAAATNSAAALNSDVTALKSSNEKLLTTVAAAGNSGESQLTNSDDGPTSIRFKGISLTPGGFVAAESVFRNRATSSDVNTQFSSIPFTAADLAHTTELNFSGRASRFSLLAQSKVSNATLSAYYEADFLGSGTTSNSRQTNSYVLRQRQVFGQAAFDNGWIITGGQQWSL